MYFQVNLVLFITVSKIKFLAEFFGNLSFLNLGFFLDFLHLILNSFITLETRFLLIPKAIATLR